MDDTRIRFSDVVRAVMASQRCRTYAARLVLVPAAVSLFFPLYVFALVVFTQLKLQWALDRAPLSVLTDLEADGVTVVDADQTGLPDVPVRLRYLQANGRTIVLLNAERRFEVKAPFVSTQFDVAAASRRQIR